MILALDIGGTRIKAGLVCGAVVRAPTSLPTRTADGVVDLPETIKQLGGDALAKGQIAGIGLCVKGIVEPMTGRLLDVNEVLAGWIGRPLAESVGGDLGYPCIVENDARMYALGEFLHGAGRGKHNLVCLTLGTGVGSGVVLGGRVLRGARGTAGILAGHVTAQVDGPGCTCGNIGCLEALIGAGGLVRSAREALTGGQPSTLRAAPLDPRRIFAAAAAGDDLARDVVQRFATYLGAGVVTMIHVYDPDIVVLGGGMARAAPQFLPAVQEYVDTHAWTVPRGRVRVVPARLGDSAALIGIAALAGGADLLQ